MALSASQGIFAKATEIAASVLSDLAAQGFKIIEVPVTDPQIRKASLQTEIQKALRQVSGGNVSPGPKLPLPNWDPTPGHADIEASINPRWVAELKLRKTDETLWDLFKMIDALNVPGVDAAFLIVGATVKQWEKQRDGCCEIFDDNGLEHHPSRELFESNKWAWWNLLHGGEARPTSIPAHVSTRLVAKPPLTLDGTDGWLKCVEVSGEGAERINFTDSWYHGNWPEGVRPGSEYFDKPPLTGARRLPLSRFPKQRVSAKASESYLAAAQDLPRRSLTDLGCEISPDGDAGERTESWNFVLDGPRVFVTSSSGMYLRCHIHHIAIGEALPRDEVGCSYLFIACRRVKVYADYGRTGWLDTIYRGTDLKKAIAMTNSEFESWLYGEHGIDRQPPGQGRIGESDFAVAFAEHPNQPGEADAIADALAYPLCGMKPPTEAGPLAVLHFDPYRKFPSKP